MPAILIEISIYSAPGTVEFLPAMPASLRAGSIEGVWLSTWAKLERMEWTEMSLKATLVSNKSGLDRESYRWPQASTST